MQNNLRPESMQRITTKEPDDEQIECAIMSLKAALPDEFPAEEVKTEEIAPEENEANDSTAE